MAIPKIHWRLGPMYTQPLWTTVPDISLVEAISRQHLIPRADTASSVWELTVTPLAEGAFNKIYTVLTRKATTSDSRAKAYIFRVSLPVEPGDKVRNEIATLDYIKQHTTIPVPTVLAYDSSSSYGNALGFEWILMEKVPGAQLSDIWPRLSDSSKGAITREIASYVMQMRTNCVFRDIGGLYHNSDSGFTIGPIVTQFMFMGPRRQLMIRNRGPFEHDSDFVQALIDVQVADIHLLNTMLSNDPNFDQDLFEDGPEVLRVMEELRSLIPVIFSPGERNDQRPVFTALLHPDLSLNNIMIDPTTLKITGIIDWECTNASPPWQHTYPQFLVGPEVEEEPPRVELGETNIVLIERWDDWEKMRLRKVFDEVTGPLVEDPLAALKREFISHLEVAEYSQVMVERWIKQTKEMLGTLS